jgi:hypothetical protein
LTHAFQILCSVPPIICAFSFSLLNIIQPRRRENLFILCSALLTGGFLFNEIYRIHIILLSVGIPKLVTVSVYSIFLFGYAIGFRQRIQATPYLILLTGLSLLFLGITVDSLHLGSEAIPTFLEGIPKLFSEINIAFYFWYICYSEVVRSLKYSPQTEY